MKDNCKNCEYSSWGGYDPCSDICDGCMNDADTGWGGFMDHRVGMHFMSEKEQREFYTSDIAYIRKLKINRIFRKN